VTTNTTTLTRTSSGTTNAERAAGAPDTVLGDHRRVVLRASATQSTHW
jgi:hypothetical protein